MKTREIPSPATPARFGRLAARLWTNRVAGAAAFGVLVGFTAWSAVLAKEANFAPALAKLSTVTLNSGGRASDAQVAALGSLSGVAERIPDGAAGAAVVDLPGATVESSDIAESSDIDDAQSANGGASPWGELVYDPQVRWFNGRPARPARTIKMVVTAYSPDERSCGESADGITATLHSVETNGYKLVAADPRVLKYGAMITVPGYDDDHIVPVLDCGGAIKGRRLDVLFPTHAEARAWGVRTLRVVVWEYADGGPAENPRKVR